MLVSKKASTGICVSPIEDKPVGQRATKLAQRRQRPLSSLIAAHFKNAAARNSNLNLVTVLQPECLHNGGGKAYRQTVSPLRNLHRPLQLIYILYCISKQAGSHQFPLRFLLGDLGGYSLAYCGEGL